MKLRRGAFALGIAAWIASGSIACEATGGSAAGQPTIASAVRRRRRRHRAFPPLEAGVTELPTMVITVPFEEGVLDGSEIEKGLRNSAGGLRSCYERGLRNFPDMQGRVDIAFTIGVTGRVTSVGTVISQGAEAGPAGWRPVQACIEAAIASIRFPAPVGGPVEGTTSVRFLHGE